MGAGVVTIGRKQYAIGLYWENSPSGGSLSKVARDAAKQSSQKSAFFATRGRGKTERVPQFGLGQEGCGYKVAMPVLSACLANQQPGSWVGAFRVKEGTIVIVVRDDLIVPDGDQIYVDEIEARDRLLQEIGFGGLQRTFAPEAWSVPGADTMPLSILLNNNADTRLQPVVIPKIIILGGILSALLLVGLLAWGWYLQAEVERQAQLVAEQAAEEQRAKMEAELVQNPFAGKPIEYPPPERFWEEAPIGVQVVGACKKAYDKANPGIVGWILVNVVCDGTGLSLTYQRDSTGSGYAALPDWLMASPDGQNAGGAIAVEPALTARGAEELINPVDVTERILGQNWGATLGEAPPDPPPPPPPGRDAEDWNPPPPPWVKRSFTLTVPVLPWTLGDFFQDFPGLMVKSLSYQGTGSAGVWSVEGVIYENRR